MIKDTFGCCKLDDDERECLSLKKSSDLTKLFFY